MAVATATALLGSALLGAGGAAYAANKGAKATDRAADAATGAAGENNALARDIYDQNRNVLNPYIEQGVANSGRLNALLESNPFNYTPGQFEADPGYEFRMKEGLGRVTQSRAVGGLLKSGSALKALNDYAQGQASQEYGAWFNRDQARIAGQNDTTSRYVNALANQQGVGMAAGSALAGVGQNYVNTTSANNNNAATVTGNAALAGANQTGNLVGQGINALSYAVGNGVGQRGSSYAPANTYQGQPQMWGGAA